MALPRGEFTTLLRSLRAAGPVERVRLLARSLSALRGLSPWDRKILLRMAGFEGAEALVERLSREDEETAARLRGLIGELEKRPDELERTVQDLADPGRRGAAVDELLATLDRGMGGGEVPEEAPEAPSSDRARDRVPESPPEPVPEPPPVPPPGPAPASLPEPPPVPERPVLLAPPPSEVPEPPSEAIETEEPPSPEGAPPEPEPGPEPGPDAESEPEVELELEAEPEPGPESAPPTPAPALLTRPPTTHPASAPGVLERLLDLRRRAAGGDGPDAAALGRILEAEIPYPWARRRAVQAWIEGGGAADLDGALGLIAELPAAADRTWCLATLAQRGGWSDGQWERILEAAPTAAARRRLERRRKTS